MAIVTGLVTAYPREMTEPTVAVYVEDLRDLPPKALMDAVVKLRRSSKWLPTIAEIRAEVAKATLPDAKPVAEAWTEAVQLMAKIGSYRGLGSAGSPYVNRTLRLCGRWADICQEDMAWLRKRFAEIYTDVVGSAQAAVATRGQVPEWLEHRTPLVALDGGRKALPRG